MVYIFTRNKKTGYKKVIAQRDSIEEARDFCTVRNNATERLWYEFTEELENTKN